jgi:hypothetical protein
MHLAFTFAAIATGIAVIASALRGRRYLHRPEPALEELAEGAAESPGVGLARSRRAGPAGAAVRLIRAATAAGSSAIGTWPQPGSVSAFVSGSGPGTG